MEFNIKPLRSPKPSRKQELEAIVKERPFYDCLYDPQYDPVLMEAHLELSIIYHEERNPNGAHSHLSSAIYHFSNMADVKTGNVPGERIINYYELLHEAEKRKKTEKELQDYKTRFLAVAKKIDYDPVAIIRLVNIPTNDDKNTFINYSVE